MSMTIGDEAYQPKRFPHAEAQSVVPAMSTLPALLRSLAVEPETMKNRRTESIDVSSSSIGPITPPAVLSDSSRPQIVSARTTLPKNLRSDEHFDRSFAFYRKWKANHQTKKKTKNHNFTVKKLG